MKIKQWMIEELRKRKLRSRRHAKEGSLSFGIVFIFLFVILIFFFSFAIPFMMSINTAFYEAGEDVLEFGNETAGEINDAGVRDSIQDIFTQTKDSFVEQTTILGFFAQYGWLIIVFVIMLIIVIIARRQVESEVI